MADYLLLFRKTPAEGDNMSAAPIERVNGLKRWVGDPALDPRKSGYHPSPYARKERDEDRQSIVLWRRYAEPVWWDIDQTDVLNFQMVRSNAEEKHICPLQLGLIRRAIYLWSHPGDVVASPFAGIGSEGVAALEERRKFIGVELSENYFGHASKNLEYAERMRDAQPALFAEAEA